MTDIHPREILITTIARLLDGDLATAEECTQELYEFVGGSCQSPLRLGR